MDGKYLNLIDMIDGGGAGRAGDTFEGGGLLSALANAFAKPYGYEDRLRDRKNNTGRAIMTAVDSLRSSPRPQMRPEPRQPATGYTYDQPMVSDIPPAYEYGGNRQMMQQDFIDLPEIWVRDQDFIDLPEVFLRGNVEGSGMTPANAYMPDTLTDPMFAKFVEQQRMLEQEYGFKRQSLAEIEDMFQLYKMRGRF
jgi:hypothetical protein